MLAAGPLAVYNLGSGMPKIPISSRTLMQCQIFLLVIRRPRALFLSLSSEFRVYVNCSDGRKVPRTCVAKGSSKQTLDEKQPEMQLLDF